MAQPATTAKLEELRFKLKTDPKSRLFYQLAEELRKAGHFDESELVLRSGLIVYPTYLAAWVSLGRTLREQKNDGGAVEALNRALQLDPGNVVAARILADAYLALGEKVEAIKKYKLVHALLPSDEELRLTIERLESEIREPEPEPEPTPEITESEEVAETIEAPIPSAPFEEDSPFDRTMPPFAEARSDAATADDEPMLVAHEESPFEEPVNTFTADAFEVEAPSGMHIEEAPLEEEPIPVFEPESNGSDAANTATMADLYVRQGLVDDARHIYENILARDPGNADVRAKLDAITPRTKAKVAALERWLIRVSRREVESV